MWKLTGRLMLFGGEGETPWLLAYGRCWGVQAYGIGMGLWSSYEDGWVGGESPMRLIKLEGEAPKGPVCLVQSLALGAVLTEAEVVDTASKVGDTVGFPFIGMDAGIVGFRSGEGSGGGDSGDGAISLIKPPFL